MILLIQQQILQSLVANFSAKLQVWHTLRRSILSLLIRHYITMTNIHLDWMVVNIAFGGKEKTTAIYIKLDAVDQLLLSKGYVAS